MDAESVTQCLQTSFFARASSDSKKQRLSIHVIKEERAKFEKALSDSQGKKEVAAKILGISRATCYRKLKQYGFA